MTGVGTDTRRAHVVGHRQRAEHLVPRAGERDAGDDVDARTRSQIFPLLQPETAYTFTVQARDFAGHVSPVSEPVAATTPAPNPDDVTAPTTPTLGTGYVEGCEVQLLWTESTDDFDPQFAIEYEIYLNGVHVDSTALRFTNRVVYANQNGVNTFAVAAVDSAGNRSPLSNEFSDIFDGCVF